jgi:membrane protease YdiL (CAAX protease family)
MSFVLLAAVAALLAWFMRTDLAEYAAFKALTRTEDRQRVLRRWTLRSLLFFLGSALAVLLILGRLDSLVHMPAEFRPLSARLSGLLFGHGSKGAGSGFLIGFGAALAGSAIACAVIAALLARRRTSSPPARADIEPLFPRNKDERRWTALFGANAGPGEEVFFRLMLPLLLVAVTGNALLAFALAAAIFGLLHLYQGLFGVAATALAGLFFTFVYLATGSIWIAALLHSLANLNTLWLRPLLAQRAQD